MKLPVDVKIARSQCKAAFDSWKDNKYPGDNEIHNVYRSKRKDYRSLLRCFLNQVEIYEMILLIRLDDFATHKGFFSEMQFGFQEGVGCTKASFTILETINHMLERSSKVLSCFLDVRKAFDTVWID